MSLKQNDKFDEDQQSKDLLKRLDVIALRLNKTQGDKNRLRKRYNG